MIQGSKKILDCLLIGYNEPEFEKFEMDLRRSGKKSGEYRYLNLDFIELSRKKFTALGLLNHFRNQTGNQGMIHWGESLNLAVAYLSSYLTGKGLSIDYINLFQSEKDALAALLKRKIRTIAITTTFYVSPQPIIEIVSFIHKFNKTAKIIIGGPFIVNRCIENDGRTLMVLLRSLDADFYVNSPNGEYMLYRIIEALANKKPFNDISHIIYRKGDSFVFTQCTPGNNDEEIDFINWNIFKKENIRGAVNIRTARGCPYKCSFCTFPVLGGKFSYLPVPMVEKELNILENSGRVKYLAIIDDTFNIPQDRFKELCRIMIRNKYDFNWFSYCRCQYLDTETIELMTDSGCKGVFLGIESGSSTILKNMNKEAEVEKYKRGISLLKQYGITIMTSFIVGFPGETIHTVRQTIDFIEETKPNFYKVHLWCCDKNAPIMQKKEKYQIKGTKQNWSHKTMDFSQACDLIDKIFLTVKNSLWLPLHSFDFWIIPNLRAHGMSMDQFTEFIKIFNILLREKISKIPKIADRNILLRGLADVCNF